MIAAFIEDGPQADEENYVLLCPMATRLGDVQLSNFPQRLSGFYFCPTGFPLQGGQLILRIPAGRVTYELSLTGDTGGNRTELIWLAVRLQLVLPKR